MYHFLHMDQLAIITVCLMVAHLTRPCHCRATIAGTSRQRMANISIESNSIQRLASGTEATNGVPASAEATVISATVGAVVSYDGTGSNGGGDGDGNFAAGTSNHGNNKHPPKTVQKELKRVFLSNRTVTCNDGSQAGFYLRKSAGSRRWVVFFEGGWHCYDHKTCRARWLKLRHLMTSAQWPETRDVGGLLSPLPSENPYWYNANHVFVPYCSSDSWSGTKVKPDTRDGLRFMGSLIVRQVIADLIPLGLGHSQGADLLMAGSSAGGLGVMLNLDKVRSFLQKERGLKVSVRGVSDSGWFLDREPYTPGAVAAWEAVRQGWRMWDGALPQACVAEHTREPWRCYFGYRLYNTLKSPLFVFQWLFDEAQMRADHVGAPVTPQQWDYIHDMGGALRESLNNVSAVFAPSCIGHSVLTKRDWLNIRIDDISLADALRCWEQSDHREKQILRRQSNRNPSPQKLRRKHNGSRRAKLPNEMPNAGGPGQQKGEEFDRPKLTKEERERRRQERRERQNQRRLNRMNKKNGREGAGRNHTRHQQMKLEESQSTNVPRLERSPNSAGNGSNSLNPNRQNPQQNGRHRLRNQNKKRLNHKNRNRKNTNNRKQQQQNRNVAAFGLNIAEPKKCSLRLLERCSWPQCNHSCPTLTNPLTGEEMKFLELLASFGLDMDAVATALGVDMQTLNNMDHAELVNLLTQQVT
ncbi:palmitoleoyl-protein carboxylesterase NOTUM isoform X2 [Wyeomyia smithii]|uniref:palmitoleoyl-protein carboxylesterase NOTUM isoform X2 n=1 Tax=Wyeomyia smithii TaxID=174621 RepID=UPI002467AEC8|nr:palmitoleoyl-protein carboxylesterase NOTUM isoform X2 [Wyeomyia smithii]XP_055535883.1 palmitoleoyl-protein carboxylesterase NOTUM isoform X2 [Wyeomyia smithii]